MIADRPLLGWGPGSFPHEGARYNFPRADDPVRFGRQFRGAHSAFLTDAAEDGLPAACLLAVAGLLALAMLCRRPGQEPSAAVQGVAAALAALLAQAFVEDLPQRPALVLGAALLAGAALSSSRGWRLPSTGDRRAFGMVPAVALVVATLFVAATGILLPYAAWRAATKARAKGPAGVPEMRRAARLDPWNAEYHHDLAMASVNSGPPSPGRYAAASLELERARECHWRDPRFALLLARLEALAGRSLFDDASADERAARLYDEAVRLAPFDPRPRFEQAGHLSVVGRTDDAIASLAAALAVEPNYRRARLAQALLLVRVGRRDEATAALDELARSDALLATYAPLGGYGREIIADAPTLRRQLEEATGPIQQAAPGMTSR